MHIMWVYQSNESFCLFCFFVSLISGVDMVIGITFMANFKGLRSTLDPNSKEDPQNSPKV